MMYTIKPLSPELAATFVEFLESMDFSHATHWATCFCRFYQTNCSMEQWQKRTGKDNCSEAIEQIKAGNMRGYLAFHGDKCIGWCNANNVKQYIRIEEDIRHLVNDQKVGCAICFVIHKEYRNQGVARVLLKQAVEDYRMQYYDAVLALPVDIKGEPEKLYRGTMNMYRELGFLEIERQDNVSIMWLKLN